MFNDHHDISKIKKSQTTKITLQVEMVKVQLSRNIKCLFLETKLSGNAKKIKSINICYDFCVKAGERNLNIFMG